jgi:hypothetical protein
MASSGFSSSSSLTSFAFLIRGLMVVLKFFKSVSALKVTVEAAPFYFFVFLVAATGSISTSYSSDSTSCTTGVVDIKRLAALSVASYFSSISPLV